MRNRWDDRALEMEAVANRLRAKPYLQECAEIADRYARFYRKKADRWWRRWQRKVTAA